MIKKIKLIIFILLIVSISSGAFLFFKQEQKQIEQSQTIFIKVSGAVNYSGVLPFKKGVKLREVFFKFFLKSNADISSFDLEEKIFENKNFFIQEKKENKKSILDVNEKDLEKISIREKIIVKLMEFILKNKGNKVTWEDFLKIPGIGEKTLNLLKKEFTI
ncbi:MAG0490 family ComEA-like DNA-binding protein [Mesomycoplasma molare]|uniref:Competence protein ComEA n=1 Tax=Mesomycoplasma molare TaxID=171288 RepID=A0ABY5TV08_9BACT|nr:hypothetical protein [Mesomycoplasma molare]UWD34503.1 hypothetical protein NX772_01580 [Mesomycoplasma molare]